MMTEEETETETLEDNIKEDPTLTTIKEETEDTEEAEITKTEDLKPTYKETTKKKKEKKKKPKKTLSEFLKKPLLLTTSTELPNYFLDGIKMKKKSKNTTPSLSLLWDPLFLLP